MREHIIINNDRTVVIPASLYKVGNRFDHGVNKVIFDCPRYADEEQTIDLSTMKIYINYIRSDKEPLSSLAMNVTVDETDPTIMHFVWDITRSVTFVDGVLDCLVCIKSTNSEGAEEHHWNSDIFSKLFVGKGMENTETIAEENIDLITQLLLEVDTAKAEVSGVSDRIDGVYGKVGALEALATEDKSSVVAAVNEVKESSDNVAESVDGLKSDLVDVRTSIDVFESEEKVNTTINTNGKYWNTSKTNSWGTHNDYAVTNIVSFKKGTTIAFKAYGEPNVAFFVETTSPTHLNQNTTGISLNFEQKGYLEGRYTFKADTSISFSYNTKKDFYVNIVEKTNKVVEYYGKVDNLENKVANLENKATEYYGKVDNLGNKVADLENVNNYIPMFRNIGIVGDSLSSGEIAYSDESGNHYVDRFDSSWLSIIGRNNGVNISHYSQGGMTTKAWLEDAGNKKTSLLADDSKNAYFVALGTNDISESYPLGNVSDTSSTNSFVGYLKNIIDVVHTKSPNSVVFLVSTYNNTDNAIRYSNMISEIADLYEYCFFVDFVNHTDIYTSTGGVWSNLGHFTSLGYVKVAKIIEKLLNKIVDENKNYFKFFTLNN